MIRIVVKISSTSMLNHVVSFNTLVYNRQLKGAELIQIIVINTLIKPVFVTYTNKKTDKKNIATFNYF